VVQALASAYGLLAARRRTCAILAHVQLTTRATYPQTLFRGFGALALGLLLVAWLSSWPLLLPTTDTPVPPDQPLLARLDRAPSWGDTLILDLAIADPGVQVRAGWIIWTNEAGDQGMIPLRVLANGQPQRASTPIGIHPAWRDAPRDIRVTFAAPVMAQVRVQHVALITRPAWALDALLGRLLMPALTVVPPLASLVLLTGALLGAAGALLVPWAHWRRRLGVLAWGLGGLVALSSLAALGATLAQLLPRYGALSEPAAAGRVTSYNASSALTPTLIAAAAALPDAPVLVLDSDPESFLVYRARYLLYPRRVDTTIATRAPSRVAEMLAAGGYGALIQTRASARAPAPGWQRVGDRSAGPMIWANPQIAPPPPAAPAGPWALPRLLGAMLCVALGGGAGARLLGWRGAAAGAAAWPLGTILLAWWMALLGLAHVPWAVWSVGLPLGLTGLILLARSPKRAWRPLRLPHIPRPRPTWGWAGAIFLGLLVAAVTLQALLLPFTDQDTWKIWAFKAKGFALDGALAPVLTLYPQSDMHHAAYPPAQPLLLAWGYLSMGGLSERLVKLVFPLWYLACVLIVWIAGRQWGLRRAAAGWALLLASTPLLLDHATLGNADLPLAALWALAAVALVHWLDTGRPRWLWAGVLVLSGAAWVKVDGQGVGAGILLAAALVRAVALRRQGRPLGPALALGAAALLVFLLGLIPWVVVTRRLGLIDPTPGGSVLAAHGAGAVGEALRVMGEELLLSHTNSAWGLLGGGFGALWLLSLGAVLIGWPAFRRDPAVWLLALIVLGGLAAYVGVYALRPFHSIDRYVLHLAPAMVLLAARATRPAPAIQPTAQRAACVGMSAASATVTDRHASH
jgi:hypothetical protein